MFVYENKDVIWKDCNCKFINKLIHCHVLLFQLEHFELPMSSGSLDIQTTRIILHLKNIHTT